jgi:hypothetical protein
VLIRFDELAGCLVDGEISSPRMRPKMFSSLTRPHSRHSDPAG